VHLFGFIIKLCYDARTHERKILNIKSKIYNISEKQTIPKLGSSFTRALLLHRYSSSRK